MTRPVVLFPRIILALFIFLMSGTPEAFACRLDAPFNIADIDNADVIFLGRVVKYEPFLVTYHPDQERPHSTVNMMFEVHKIYKGDQSASTIEVLWWGNLTESVPKDFSEFIKLYGRDFLVGVRKASPRKVYSSSSNSKIMNLHEVIQGPCSPPFLFEYDNGQITDRARAGSEVEHALRALGMLE